MSIDSEIYARLNDTSITAIVGSEIHPTEPGENAAFPMLVYTVGTPLVAVSLAGSTSTAQYTVTLDLWTRSLSQQSTLAAAVAARLHAYKGGGILGSFLTQEEREAFNDEEAGDIYHCTQTYTVWFYG